MYCFDHALSSVLNILYQQLFFPLYIEKPLLPDPLLHFLPCIFDTGVLRQLEVAETSEVPREDMMLSQLCN